MALVDLEDLRAIIASTINRTDLTDYIDDFIALARVDINSRFRVGAQESTAAVTMTSGNPLLALPTNFGEIRKFIYTAGSSDIRELTLAPFSPISTDQSLNQAGYPRTYSVVGTNFFLDPIPSSAFSGTVYFYLEVPDFDFSDPADTNWLMTQYPNVWLYASLLSALGKVGNDVRAPIWSTYYQAGIDAVTGNDKAKRYAGVPRMKSALWS